MDKNEQNQTTTSYEQDEVLEFYEGLAVVKKCFDRGFIHKGGELLQHYEWDGGCKCGFIDTSGTLVIPCEWYDARSFGDGVASVQKDGKWGAIDKEGKLVIPYEWDDAFNFYDGLARVRQDRKYGFIDKSGAVAIPCEWDSADCFSEGLAGVEKDGK